MNFTIETVEIEAVRRDNSEVQAGCWGDTGTGAYC